MYLEWFALWMEIKAKFGSGSGLGWSFLFWCDIANLRMFIWNLHVNLSITISGIQTKQICRITKSKCSFRKDFTPIWTQVVEISKLQKPNFTILCCGWSAGCRGLVHRCSSLQLKVPQNNGFEVFMKLHSISIHPRIWHHVLYNQDS